METNDIAGKIIFYLRANKGKAEIYSTNLGKEWQCHRNDVWKYRERLVECGVIKKIGVVRRLGRPSGIYRLAKNFCEGDSWRAKLNTVSHRRFRKNSPLVKQRVSISRETHLDYKKAIGISRNLQAENKILEKKIHELQEELENERLLRARDANDIAYLELELRRLRQVEAGSTRRALFNRSGQV